jgi:hypothetical protein
LQQFPIKSNLIYWYSPQIVYRYQLASKFDIAGRVEHYFDKDATVTAPIKNAQLNLIGMSVNLDFKILNNALFRVEFKQLYNRGSNFRNK